jgi:linoleoyl-CoA desaturase
MFFIMHFIGGFTLTIIFQSAHVVPTSAYPLPDKEGILPNSWAIHQMMTTADFSPNSRIFSWYIGGLNYQIEHHLFPNICHVHYRKLSHIVKETAREFGIPYNVQPTFIRAVWSHGKMLKHLGRTDF